MTIPNAAIRVASRLRPRNAVRVEYRSNTDRQTGGHSHSHHALRAALARHEGRYGQVLGRIRAYDDDLCALPIRATEPGEPSLINGVLPGLDGAALYAFIRDRAPARYLEVGSGESTKFAARAKADGALAMEITSIDPNPAADVDSLCDRLLRSSLEQTPMDVFRELDAGDVVFFDGSHSAHMGNDVAVFFREVLPGLRPGVLVGVHDIYLPFDYPQPSADCYETERYVIAAYQLSDPPVDVVLPAQYVMSSPKLRIALEGMWDRPHLREVPRHGGAFWMETRGRQAA